jgi:hypothetical protein
MSRAHRMMQRFGTIEERNGKVTIGRVNRAARFMSEGYYDDKDDILPNNISEQDVEGVTPEKIMGVGASEGHGEPAYAEHTPDFVRFAGRTADGVPFIATMPRITISEGITWVQRRIGGFKDFPKSRESVFDAIRRKALAAMGYDFVDAMKNKGGKEIVAEADMMFSEQAHSGIGDIDKVSRMPGVVEITLNVEGDVSGISDGLLTTNDGKRYMTADMLNLIAAGD